VAVLELELLVDIVEAVLEVLAVLLVELVVLTVEEVLAVLLVVLIVLVVLAVDDVLEVVDIVELVDVDVCTPGAELSNNISVTSNGVSSPSGSRNSNRYIPNSLLTQSNSIHVPDVYAME
jgi:hypothetical protein